MVHLQIEFTVSLFIAASVYSFFDIIFDTISKYSESFKTSGTYTLVVSIGWICVFGGLVAGAYPVVDYLKKCFPPIEFKGKLCDPSKKSRTLIIVFTSFILAPILVNVLSSLIYEYFSK